MDSITERRSLSRRLRILVGTVVLMLMVTVGFTFLKSTAFGSTHATWQAEESATGVLNAATVPAPTLTRECDFRPGVLGLGARVEIYWSTPEGYTLEDAELLASTDGLGSILAPLTGFSLEGNTTGTPANYTTEVRTNLLGGLLGLGSELEIAIRVSHPDSEWKSETISVASNAGLIGGIGGHCRNLT